MKHLIILAHPKKESFCAAICEALHSALEATGDEVKVRDLYESDFDPVLRLNEVPGTDLAAEVRREQELVSWADHLIFIFPVWWYDRPALLKGWIDRVFSFGFAYTVENGRGKGLLTGKKASLYLTFGSSEVHVSELHPGATDWVMEAMAVGTLGYCGLECVEKVSLYALSELTPEERSGLLLELGVHLVLNLTNNCNIS